MRASCDSGSAAPCLTDDDVAAAGGSPPARSGVRELGVVAYLALPTAPPRMLGGYPDILARHASAGW